MSQGTQFIQGKNGPCNLFSKRKYTAIQVKCEQISTQSTNSTTDFAVGFFWLFLNIWVEACKQVPCSSLLLKKKKICPAFLLFLQTTGSSQVFWKNLKLDIFLAAELDKLYVIYLVPLRLHGPSEVSQGSFCYRKHL